jgi:hypothetical protein
LARNPKKSKLESLIKSAVALKKVTVPSATTVEDREHNENARYSQGLNKYAGKIPDKSRKAFIGAMDPHWSAFLSRAGHYHSSFVIRRDWKMPAYYLSQPVCLLTLRFRRYDSGKPLSGILALMRR